jgi:CheY-like chemotaxis protein
VLIGVDGNDAVALRFGDPEPDAMFVNGLMPGMCGPEAIEIIRERERAEGRPRMPIALQTGWEDAAERAARCGADTYVFAPWSTDGLLATLERLLAGRADENEKLGGRGSGSRD